MDEAKAPEQGRRDRHATAAEPAADPGAADWREWHPAGQGLEAGVQVHHAIVQGLAGDFPEQGT